MAADRMNDETLLLDFLLGRCDERQQAEVRARVESDADFRAARDGMANAFGALRLLPEPAGGEDLTARTMEKIRQDARMQELLAREEGRGRALTPTFSLRELATIAGIVLMVAAVFVPSIRHAQRLTEAGYCASNVGRIGTAMMNYANANNDAMPSAGAAGQWWLSSAGRQAVSTSGPMFALIRGGYEKPDAFQCPAVGRCAFVVKAGMNDFPDGNFIGYSYQHSLGPKALSREEFAQVASAMAILADATPLFTGGRFQPQKLNASSDNHGGRGQNVLYVDMHVGWAATPAAGVRGDNIYLVEGRDSYRGDEAPAELTDTFLLPSFGVKAQPH